MRALAASLLLLLSGCRYDGPPDVTLVAPDGGAFVSGDPLVLQFSEPIDAATLLVRVWPAVRDGEGDLADGLTPKLQDCTPAKVRCTASDVLLVADDGLSAELRLDPGGLGKADVPAILEVAAGLADEAANATGQPSYFDFLFRRTRTPNDGPVAFDQGVYLIVAEISEPLPAVLTLLTDLRVREDGVVALAGAEGDEINGAPKNTREPKDLIVDVTPEGWAVFAGGFVSLASGERFLQSDPFDLLLDAGPLDVAISGVRIDAKVVKTEAGVDRLEGTFSFEKFLLDPGPNGFEYPAGSTSFVADRVPDEDVPAGTPEVCGALCGAVIGLCTPPEDFPPPGLCE